MKRMTIRSLTGEVLAVLDVSGTVNVVRNSGCGIEIGPAAEIDTSPYPGHERATSRHVGPYGEGVPFGQ